MPFLQMLDTERLSTVSTLAQLTSGKGVLGTTFERPAPPGASTDRAPGESGRARSRPRPRPSRWGWGTGSKPGLDLPGGFPQASAGRKGAPPVCRAAGLIPKVRPAQPGGPKGGRETGLHGLEEKSRPGEECHAPVWRASFQISGCRKQFHLRATQPGSHLVLRMTDCPVVSLGGENGNLQLCTCHCHCHCCKGSQSRSIKCHHHWGAVSKGTFCIKKYTRENDPPGLQTCCSSGGRAAGRWGRGREAPPFSPSPPVL